MVLYQIALYYAYIPIPNTSEHVEFQSNICQELDLKGRIRVAPEGLNGVLSGTDASLREYQNRIETHLHATIDVKYCGLREDLSVKEQLFDYLSVNETKEVVSLVPPGGEAKATVSSSKPSYSSKRRRKKAEAKTSDNEYLQLAREIHHRSEEGAVHLSPEAWNARLMASAAEHPDKVMLLDCRNVYESNVGHFRVPMTETLLTNTRKYSELPQVFLQNVDTLAKKEHLFMYCTGGVRCERASAFLKTLLNEKGVQPQIYQLEGGIQRYMEGEDRDLYQGKNFVFDPRRYDPMHSKHVVGKCLVCNAPHDDYDNGNAPCLDKPARCIECRVLILVCNDCRTRVCCFGDDEDKPRMYCGGKEKFCLHTPPPKVLKHQDFE